MQVYVQKEEGEEGKRATTILPGDVFGVVASNMEGYVEIRVERGGEKLLWNKGNNDFFSVKKRFLQELLNFIEMAFDVGLAEIKGTYLDEFTEDQDVLRMFVAIS